MPGPKKLILLVEDEALVAEVAAETLRDFGFDVIEANTAKAALEHAGKSISGFHAAIVDIGLPDQKGDRLAAELRKLRGDLPIVVATGHSGSAVPKELRALAGVAILGKPYDASGLKAALSSLGVESS